MFTASIRPRQPGTNLAPETLSHRLGMLTPMTTARQNPTTNRTTIEPAAPGEQLRLALPPSPTTASGTAIRPAARQLPAQLRLDARTRQVGRVGIAEIRRILAESSPQQAQAA